MQVRTFLAVFVLCLAQAAPSYSPYRKLDVFARVLAHIENHYVEEVDEDQLVRAAIEGLIASLDPHTEYLSPAENRRIRADTRGEFGGVGLEVEKQGADFVVVAPIEDTPAFRAGLVAGDRLVKIDGEDTAKMSIDEVIRRMRGPAGSPVALAVLRTGWTEPRDFVLQRELIKLVSVSGRLLSDAIGYLRIKSFQRDSAEALEDELARFGSLRGLVLDLRGNPGGLLDEAVKVAELFLSQGTIVRTVGRGGQLLQEENAHPRGTADEFPMVVLVNAGSASASEIVAGALQDHGRAVIVGTPTFGKGSVQTIVDFEDGSALKLTIARYTTPLGRSIQEQGITPNVLVPDSAPTPTTPNATPLREKDLKGHLRGQHAPPPPSPPAYADDPPLSRAVEILRAVRILNPRR